MINNGFIAIAIGKSYNDIIYISNTAPLLWDKAKENAKIFESYKIAKNELEDDFISLSATISYTDITSIFIIEYKDGIEVGREKFL